MKLLITGANGQLGSEIRALVSDYKIIDVVFKDLPELDISNFVALKTFIIENKITAVINCAAFTAVDKAEQTPEISKKVNTEGVANLVKVLQSVKGKLIHLSTDYVFDGTHFMPYKESDLVSPVGVYAESKMKGELEIFNSTIDAIVIRTSWLYSSFGNNFVKTMLRLGKEKETLGVVFDQVGSPTYARGLAKTCLEILYGKNSAKISKKGKLYHYSDEGVASWYDFAIAIMELGILDCKVSPIQTKEFPTLAKRPHYSVLNKTKIKRDFNIEIPYWRDALSDCILTLKNTL